LSLLFRISGHKIGAVNVTLYGWLMLAGLAVGACFWSRLARRDRRLLWIYIAALVGAFLGAKVVYFLAEGWMDWRRPDAWARLATGKSILGGLLGGYVAVEIAKRVLGYAGTTGDWFALIAPVGIALGRIGCLAHGCCRGVECSPAWFTLKDAAGVDRWPAVPMEIAFNIGAIAGFYWLRRNHFLPGQHFHLYLIGYGVFRFFHEFLRAEPRVVGPITGYQVAALMVLALGLVGFYCRQRAMSSAGRIDYRSAFP
jgi:phosphatidylglycerol:prolipoprotein diacylglycerol transferase